MTVRARFRFAFFPLVVFAAVVAAAQVNGVAPSVTSFGFGGNMNPAPGVRASVTSLGPNGYGGARAFMGSCCANFFFYPGNVSWGTMPPFRPGHSRRRKHKTDIAFVPLAVPAYVPYADEYGGGFYEEDADESYETVTAAPRAGSAYGELTRKRDAKPAPPRESSGNEVSEDAQGSAEPEPQPPEPVVAQPATVLIFRDGHRSEVVNYAIVDDTLFDFSEGRARKVPLAQLDLPATEKANGERGVEFEVPRAGK